MVCDILLLQRIIFPPIICVSVPLKASMQWKMEDSGRKRTTLRDKAASLAVPEESGSQEVWWGPGTLQPSVPCSVNDAPGTDRGSRVLPRRSRFAPHKEIKKLNWVLRILERNINLNRRSSYKTRAWPDFNCLVKYWPPHIKKDVIKSKNRWIRYNHNEEYKTKNSLCPRSNAIGSFRKT